MEENTILCDLIKFISKVRWEYSFDITEDTKLSNDLKLFGDDAVEFILKYGREFNVDVTNFMAEDYLKNENLIDFYFGGAPKKTITINDLINGIRHGRLDEETIGK